MESLIATDGWLKDYDPLFDLFDEEMRSSRASQMMQANSGACLANSSHMASADYFSEYDLNNNYYNPYFKQTDELSLILGLEWLPCNDLNSPSTTNSSSASSTSSANSTSPASTSTPLYSATSTSQNSSGQLHPINSQCPSTPATSSISDPTNITTTQLASSKHPKSPQITTTKTITSTTTLTNKPTSSSSSSGNKTQRVFRRAIHLTKYSCINYNDKLCEEIRATTPAHSKKLNQPTSGGALKQKSCLLVNSNNNLIASNLIEPTQIVSPCSSLKKKKKCLRTRGTSLLAQPSPKSANSTCSSPVTSATSRASSSALPTLITINRPSTLMSPLQQKQHQQQMLPKTTALLSTTTTPLTCIAGKANNDTYLTKLDRTMKYCIKIEHAYSSMC